MNHVIISLLAAALISAPAYADDLTGRLGVGGNVGAAIPTGSKWLRDNAGAGVGEGGWLRYGLDEHWSAALAYDYLGFENAKAGSYIEMITLSGAYNIDPESVWNPTIHAGVGPAGVRSVESGKPTQFGLTTGFGFERFVCPGFSVGTSMDWFYSAKNMAPNHDASALRLGLNVGFWFGGAQAPKKVAETPAPVRAPAPAPKKVEIALDVQFDTDKSEVKTQYDAELSKVADFMKEYPFTRGEIEGHTDNVGGADYNRGLSQRRADAVRQALIDRFHIDATRLTAKGYGQDKPIADNGTEEGRAKNRRVVASFE
jgi:OOP family OmpA-OmpF porin